VKALKISFFVLLVVALGLMVMSVVYAPQGFPEGSATDQRAALRYYSVRSESIDLRDESRVTQANKDVPEKAGRSLAGLVFFPDLTSSEEAPFPLVIYSHGFSSSHKGGEYLGRYLAGLGFVVAMVDFPLTNMYAEGGPFVKDVVNQPADVSFLIDTLLDRSERQDDTLSGLIDAARIGAMGVSLGGFTSTLLAYHPTMGDPRIDAAISIAGPSSLFTERFFLSRSVPFMMIGGTYDVLVPYETNAAPIQAKSPDAWLLSIEGGAHTAFSGPTAAFRFLDNVDVIGCWAVLRNTEGDLDEPWYDLLGDESIGIDQQDRPVLCENPVPENAMNVVQQQWITQVAVGAFFEMTLSSDAQKQIVARDFLANTFANEIDGVQVRTPAAQTISALGGTE
jgi:predicted dienelactone hydrolase